MKLWVSFFFSFIPSCMEIFHFATVRRSSQSPGSTSWWGRQPCHIAQTGLTVFVITMRSLRKPFCTKQRVNPLHAPGVPRCGEVPNLPLQHLQGVRASLMPSDHLDPCKQRSASMSFHLKPPDPYWHRWSQAEWEDIFTSWITSYLSRNVSYNQMICQLGLGLGLGFTLRV